LSSGHPGLTFDFGFVIGANDAKRCSDKCIWVVVFGGIVAFVVWMVDAIDDIDCLRSLDITSQSRQKDATSIITPSISVEISESSIVPTIVHCIHIHILYT